MSIHIQKALWAHIFEQMQAAYPNEGGGFLLGQVNGDAVYIQDVVAVANVFPQEEQYHRYAMTPQDWMRLEDEADARELALVGYYHSHPNAPAIPSDYDRDHAWPNFIYLITSVQDGRAVEMRAWRLRPDRSAFSADDLVVF